MTPKKRSSAGKRSKAKPGPRKAPGKKASGKTPSRGKGTAAKGGAKAKTRSASKPKAPARPQAGRTPPSPKTVAKAPAARPSPAPSPTPPKEKRPVTSPETPATPAPATRPPPPPRAGPAGWMPTLDDPIVQQYIEDEVGEGGLALARIIEERQPVLGVDLIDSIEDKPSNVRKVLYKLEAARVAEYEKDTDKSGWETFTWRLTLNEVKYLLNQRRKDELADLEKQLDLERNTTFYQCPDAHARLPFEAATELQFQCPECGRPMENVDNAERIGDLAERVAELKTMIFDA